MNENFRELNVKDEYDTNGGGLCGMLLCGLIGAEVGVVIALVHNIVNGVSGNEAREYTHIASSRCAIIGACIGAYTIV